MEIVFFAVLLMVGVCLYLLPSIVASKRHHRNANSICILNIFFGWTFIGWVVSLAMAMSSNTAAERGA